MMTFQQVANGRTKDRCQACPLIVDRYLLSGFYYLAQEPCALQVPGQPDVEAVAST